MGGATHRSPSDLCPLARICVIAVMPPLAHIIHERFCCNRGSAAAASLSAGRLAAQSLNVLLQVRVGPSRLRVPVSQRGCAIS